MDFFLFKNVDECQQILTNIKIIILYMDYMGFKDTLLIYLPEDVQEPSECAR